MSNVERISLNTGAMMPMEGFGVYLVTDERECEESVYSAIKTGYRLIDTAAIYKNETFVGKAVSRAVNDGLCKREDLFITSKLWVQDMKDEDSARYGVENSLKALGLDYIDLYLEHQAANDYFSAWRGMEKAYKEGLLKNIGVSNFYPNMLANFCEVVEVVPAVNQIELHPWYTQEEALENMKYYGVIPQAWAPLGGSRYDIQNNGLLNRISQKHNKTAGQVILRWNVQRGVSVIPKSTHISRIEENFDIWDFELSSIEMEEISSLDMGYTGTRAKHLNPDYVRSLMKKKLHD